MDYNKLASCYSKLESTTKRLEKRDILSDFYSLIEKDELYTIVLLSMGQVFPSRAKDLGIASELMKKIIIRVTGSSENEFNKTFAKTGDLGLTAEELVRKKKQNTLVVRKLTTEKVYSNLRKLPDIQGSGSQDKKITLVAELLSSASSEEAKYIVRTVLGEMRIGAAAGVVRDAMAKAFEKEAKDVEKLFDVTGDFGKVALLAKEGKTAEIEIFTPIRVMLADRSKDLKEGLEKFEEPALEVKYDGFRIQIHKNRGEIKIFSRRMENVSIQFPEIVKWCRESIDARKCVMEGEALAVDKNGSPLPFQLLSRRIQRKYDIDKMVKEVPVVVKLFDLLYVNGESFMEKPLNERWKKLGEIVKKTETFGLADHLETKDFKEANEFYKRSLSAGQEGVIVKNMDAPYQPGKRVGYWLKCKEIMETLDCVITKAVAGEGKRSNWFGSFYLSVKEDDKLVEIGRMGSGTTDEQLEELTKLLKKDTIKKDGRTVKVEPKIVVEIGYEEIQQSPKYESGFALRFPRLIRLRTSDKTINDISTLNQVATLYKMQKK
jgi:DNA ligase 1